jgi:hypothetical protein
MEINEREQIVIKKHRKMKIYEADKKFNESLFNDQS